jgi:hypothetical protein
MLTGWDATALRNFQLADGTSYAEVVAQMDMALGALNADLANDALWSTLVSYTDQPDLEYRVGGTGGLERHTEYGRPDAQRAVTEGHMLPLIKWDRALGWTWDYLQDARLPQIQADIAMAAQDIRDKWRVQILTRLLQRGDDSGAANGLGTSGYSPGFATAAASTSVDFVPPTWGGTSFTSAHEHYVSIAGGAFTQAVFQDIRAELREHGHQPPFDVLIGVSDESTVRGLTGFVPVAQQLVSYGTTTSLATFGMESDEINGSYYIGMYEDCRIRVVPGMPQYYAFAYKSYGMNNPRNPLRVRVGKGQQRPQFMAMTDPRAGNATTPIQYLMLYGQFGVGVGDRTNGTPRYVNNANWSDGTPT